MFGFLFRSLDNNYPQL